MGDAPNWKRVRERIAGKWQVPALFGSLIALTGAIYTLRPPPTALDLSEANEYLKIHVAAGMYDRALELGEALLKREGDSEVDRAPIRLQVARARFGEALRLSVATESVGHAITQDYERAQEHGQPLEPADFVRMGRAYEWSSLFDRAVDVYERALAAGVEEKHELRKRVIELLRDHHLADASSVHERSRQLLADAPPHRLDLKLWAIEEQLYALELMGQLEKGTTLLSRHAELFRGSDFEARFAFLEALLLYKTGYYDEAEARARAILNQTHRQDSEHVRAAWLAGRVVMFDDGPKRPTEAITFFEIVAGIAPNTPYGVASFLGMAESLVLLQRHAEAIDAYRVALQLLPNINERRLVNREVVRTSLGVSARRAAHMGHAHEAVSYGELAVSLIDPSDVEQATLVLQQLAGYQIRLAEELSTRLVDEGGGSLTERVRSLHSAVADTYSKIAQLNLLNERRGADAAWRAAEAATRAGETDRAVRMFETYVQERPGDPLVPRALLRIGQMLKATGQIERAITAFQDCYRRFPRTLDGGRALIPLAECYLARMPADAELAEKTLNVILEESEVFTPEAPEFSDALFLLGEAQVRQGDFERAIATFEEVLTRFPNDPRVWRGRFLLADAYRQSALAVKSASTQARSIAEITQLRETYTERFAAARSRFRELIDGLRDRSPASLDPLEELYLRHSLLYEADCYFETQEYPYALKLYEEAAGFYRDHPSGLAAYLQIINCHVFLGEPNEARAALSRAMAVVESVPPEAFERSISPETRDDWKRYFAWLSASELF